MAAGCDREGREEVASRLGKRHRATGGDTARQTSGTGLGLSIVAQTVAQHGGWVKASRSAQGGAELTIQLPGATSLEALTQPSPDTGSTSRKVVENDKAESVQGGR